MTRRAQVSKRRTENQTSARATVLRPPARGRSERARPAARASVRRGLGARRGRARALRPSRRRRLRRPTPGWRVARRRTRSAAVRGTAVSRRAVSRGLDDALRDERARDRRGVGVVILLTLVTCIYARRFGGEIQTRPLLARHARSLARSLASESVRSTAVALNDESRSRSPSRAPDKATVGSERNAIYTMQYRSGDPTPIRKQRACPTTTGGDRATPTPRRDGAAGGETTAGGGRPRCGRAGRQARTAGRGCGG